MGTLFTKPEKPAEPESAKGYIASGRLAETTIAELAKTVEKQGKSDWKEQVRDFRQHGVGHFYSSREELQEGSPSDQTWRCLGIPKENTLVLLGTVEEILQFFTLLGKRQSIVAIALIDVPNDNKETEWDATTFALAPNAMRIWACCAPLTEGKVLLAIGDKQRLAVGDDVRHAQWKVLPVIDKFGVINYLWLDDDFRDSLVDATSSEIPEGDLYSDDKQ